MRGVYVATIPLLAVLLLGLLTLAPRAPGQLSRGKIAFATVLALGGAALLMWGIESWAQSLNVGTLSPRPFMTRWVNLLIVEPQDNSFPCVEIVVATILSVGIGAAHRGWGAVAALATLLLMAARLFCGSNYFADVGVGAAAGVGLMLFCLGACGAPETRNWSRGLAGLGALTLGGTALGAFIVMASMPRFAGKMQLPWGDLGSSAAALTTGAPRAARNTLQEGEGMPTLDMGSDGTIRADEYAGEAEAQALDKRASLFLPKTEAFLTQILTPKALPFRLVDVEVAPVNFKDGSYIAAALRFEIDPKTPDVRRLVAQRAATLVKAAFAADPKLDNVDVTGVVTGDSAQSDDNLMRFAGDEVPVFTASIQRRNLVVREPRWANAPGLEGGLWLRTRSRLWIDDKLLPRLPETPKPAATPKAVATPTTAATPLVTATPIAKTGAPIIVAPPKVAPKTATTPSAATPSATTTVKPIPIATPTAIPAAIPNLRATAVPPRASVKNAQPTTRPKARPRLRRRKRPLAQATPAPQRRLKRRLRVRPRAESI